MSESATPVLERYDPATGRFRLGFLGTNQDNVDDCRRKGRHARLKGEQNGDHRLSVGQVLEIRRRWEAGERGLTALGREFGVSDTAIRYVVTRKLWRHV